MMPVNHITSCVTSCVTSLFWPMLPRAYGEKERERERERERESKGASNRVQTAVDLMATGVTVYKHFLNGAYSPLTYYFMHKKNGKTPAHCLICSFFF